jgi:ribonuclease R
LFVEGLVHITELGGEYYRFDEARQELRGERSGMRYAIGTRVNVQVSRVDLDGRRIDFRLVPDALTAGARGAGERVGAEERKRSDFKHKAAPVHTEPARATRHARDGHAPKQKPESGKRSGRKRK